MAGTTLRTFSFNPSLYSGIQHQETLRELVAAMPNAQKTEFGNYNVNVKVTARSKASTFVVSNDPNAHSDQTISLERARKWPSTKMGTSSRKR